VSVPGASEIGWHDSIVCWPIKIELAPLIMQLYTVSPWGETSLKFLDISLFAVELRFVPACELRFVPACCCAIPLDAQAVTRLAKSLAIAFASALASG